MNHTFIILKYLYKNNDGEYHSVIDAYKGKDSPGSQLLLDRINEIRQLGYLEVQESGKLTFVGITPITDTEPGNITDYKARLKPGGEEYIDSKVFVFGNWIIKKNSFLGVIIRIISN